MDLFKKTRTFCDYIGEWLDGERTLLEPDAAAPFESRDDVENLGASIPLGRVSGAARLDSVFRALSPYFEAGFDLRRHEGEWFVRGTFLYGRTFSPDEVRCAPFTPPPVPPGGVVRGRGAPVVRAFRLEALAGLRDSGAFVFDVRPGARFVLLSEKPAPWIDAHVERARAALDEWLAPRPPAAQGRGGR